MKYAVYVMMGLWWLLELVRQPSPPKPVRVDRISNPGDEAMRRILASEDQAQVDAILAQYRRPGGI